MKRLLPCACAILITACLGTRPDAAGSQTASDEAAFPRLVEHFSEPGAYFDTDNLISNERSYLHAVSVLRDLGVRGGAYIGVGPDQNFSYIAAIRPKIAFIVDIRRDNLLQHLMFKAIFSLSRSRIEYLCLLHGRPLPETLSAWRERDVEDLVAYVDSAAATPSTIANAGRAVVLAVQGFGVPLSEEDIAVIRRFHSSFMRAGLDLRFQSHGRVPLPHYPTFRQLILERDLAGERASYLADESAYQFVRALQAEDRIIPVVGDFAGNHALATIAEFLEEAGEPVAAFYTSNVEYYLMRNGGFARFAANVARLPHDEGSVIIRSFFGRNFGFVHPQAVPGYHTVQLLQSIEQFLTAVTADAYGSYFDLITRDLIELEVHR